METTKIVNTKNFEFSKGYTIQLGNMVIFASDNYKKGCYIDDNKNSYTAEQYKTMNKEDKKDLFINPDILNKHKFTVTIDLSEVNLSEFVKTVATNSNSFKVRVQALVRAKYDDKQIEALIDKKLEYTFSELFEKTRAKKTDEEKALDLIGKLTPEQAKAILEQLSKKSN